MPFLTVHHQASLPSSAAIESAFWAPCYEDAGSLFVYLPFQSLATGALMVQRLMLAISAFFRNMYESVRPVLFMLSIDPQE